MVEGYTRDSCNTGGKKDKNCHIQMINNIILSMVKDINEDLNSSNEKMLVRIIRVKFFLRSPMKIIVRSVFLSRTTYSFTSCRTEHLRISKMMAASGWMIISPVVGLADVVHMNGLATPL